MSGVTSVTSTGADESTVQKYYAINMMKTVMEEALGDGMEFEIFYQAMLDSMDDENSQINQMLSGLTSTNNNSNFSTSTGMLLEDIDSKEDPLVALCINSQLNKINNSINTNEASYSDEVAKISQLVEKYSSLYGVDSNLILQVINAESGFDSNAVSSAGAKGLMQLMPSVCEQFGVKDVFDEEENIKAGVNLLSQHLNNYNNDVYMALMAYNAGAGTVASRGVTSAEDLYKMPSETQHYVTKIMSTYLGS